MKLAQRFQRWAVRRSTAEHQIALTHRNLYIVPTVVGFFWLAVFGLVWVGAANYDNNPARFLAWWLLSVFFVAMWKTHRQLQGAKVRLLSVSEAPVDEFALVKLQLEDVPHGIEVQIDHGEWQRWPSQQSVFSGQVTVPQRGYYALPPIKLRTQLPFGLFRCWTVLRFTKPCIGYPAPLASVYLPCSQHASDDAEQASRQVIHGSGEDFNELRAYQPGEPLSRVDWKALAKTQQWFSKHYGSPSAGAWILDFDRLSGQAEQRLSVLCFWVLAAQASQQALGLRLGPQYFDLANSELHYRQILKALALYGMGESNG
ncbi:DUF58 domain-containing protein [Umboniibacter marinipuniceus]|uniref:Uncharacterized protein (DUF58 family) n=1 Tax=Umboniibacter marinipuniceus TaxID=569599 RepID=A0A3M0A2A2_9GAMM|nr:DUF58 domain-containing protein [Umboniibacter marinipuniceus]RMA78960.1 uncharacterized protein (DUF58 family) [Umboniibacter marinipuniceus]